MLTTHEALTNALTLAAQAHRNQKDLNGLPYILHPLGVASRLKTLEQKTVAFLHDVIEDTDWELDELTAEGFDPMIVQAVDALTRREGETYYAFIDRTIEGGLLPITVKIADIQENLRPDRPHANAESMRPRYQKALDRLQSAIQPLGDSSST